MRRGDDDRFGADVDLQKQCDGPLRAIVLTQHGGLICTVCVSTRRRALCLNMQKLAVCFFCSVEFFSLERRAQVRYAARPAFRWRWR